MSSQRTRSPETERSIARVRSQLDVGQRRFVWTRGVLGAGVPLFIAMSLLPSMGLTPWLTESTEKPVFNVMTGAALWALSGYLIGLLIWRGLEWRHEALMRR